MRIKKVRKKFKVKAKPRKKFKVKVKPQKKKTSRRSRMAKVARISY